MDLNLSNLFYYYNPWKEKKYYDYKKNITKRLKILIFKIELNTHSYVTTIPEKNPENAKIKQKNLLY